MQHVQHLVTVATVLTRDFIVAGPGRQVLLPGLNAN